MNDIAHVVADYESLRTKVLSGERHAIELLSLATHALEHGRLEIVAEYIDRSLGHLRSNVDASTNFTLR